MIARDDTRASVERRKAFMDIERAIAEAVAAEREACAKVCDERAKKHRDTPTDDLGESYQLGHATDEANACAAAIRARGGAS